MLHGMIFYGGSLQTCTGFSLPEAITDRVSVRGAAHQTGQHP